MVHNKEFRGDGSSHIESFITSQRSNLMTQPRSQSNTKFHFTSFNSKNSFMQAPHVNFRSSLFYFCLYTIIHSSNIHRSKSDVCCLVGNKVYYFVTPIISIWSIIGILIAIDNPYIQSRGKIKENTPTQSLFAYHRFRNAMVALESKVLFVTIFFPPISHHRIIRSLLFT